MKWGTLTAAGFCLFVPVALFLLGCVSFCHILLSWLLRWSFYASCCATEPSNMCSCSRSFSFSVNQSTSSIEQTEEGDDPCNLTFPFYITTDLLTWWRRAVSSMKATQLLQFRRYNTIKIMCIVYAIIFSVCFHFIKDAVFSALIRWELMGNRCFRIKPHRQFYIYFNNYKFIGIVCY